MNFIGAYQEKRENVQSAGCLAAKWRLRNQTGNLNLGELKNVNEQKNKIYSNCDTVFINRIIWGRARVNITQHYQLHS